MSVCNLATRLAISLPIELKRLHYKSFGVVNQSAFLGFQTILVDFNSAGTENQAYIDIGSNNRFNAAFLH
jgi:hypothetical protein